MENRIELDKNQKFDNEERLDNKALIETLSYLALKDLSKKELFILLEKSKFNTTLLITRLQELKQEKRGE